MASMLAITSWKFCSKQWTQCKYISKALIQPKPVCLLSDPGYRRRMVYTSSSCSATSELEKTFYKTFDDLLEFTLTELADQNLHAAAKWMRKVMYFNLYHNQNFYGISLVKSYEMMASQQDLTPENIYLAHLLGWCSESLQSLLVIVDDIMDQSPRRRNRPCWYKMDGVGLQAIRDAILLEKLAFIILKKYFSKHPAYIDFFEIFQESFWCPLLGQTEDMLSTPDSTKPDLTKFTRQRFYNISIFKTSYFIIAMPVKLAALLAGKKDSYTKEVEDILLRLGHFVQVQNDVVDYFTDPKVTGKEASDIENGKCTWLVVVALEKANPEQYSILQENYGMRDEKCVQRVRDVYGELGLLQAYLEHAEQERAYFNKAIEMLPPSCEMPRKVLYNMLTLTETKEVDNAVSKALSLKSAQTCG